MSDGIDRLSQRNAEIARDAIRRMESRVQDYESTVAALQETVTMLLLRVQELERDDVVRRAHAFGHGPSEVVA